MKYTKAVSATLASALAVGMVPAMALADEAAPEVVADDELELLTMTPAEAFAAGEVTAVSESVSDLDDIEFKYDGKAHKVTPTKVKPGQGDVITLDESFDIAYYAASYVDGELVVDDSDEIDEPIKEVGLYVAAVTAPADPYEGAVVYLPFSIVAKSLDGLTFYEPNDDVEDGGLSDETFVYSGSAFAVKYGTLGVKLDGKPFDFADTTKVQTYKKGPNGLYAIHSGDIVDAGEYLYERIGAEGTAYEGSKVQIPLTIGQADLSKLKLTLDNVALDTQNSVPTYELDAIGGQDEGALEGLGTGEYTFGLTGFDGPAVAPGGKGEYTYTLALTEDYLDGNLTGTAKIKFYAADEKLDADCLFYGNQPVGSVVRDGNDSATGIQMTIDHSLAQADLDFSKFSFCETSTYDKDEKVATTYVITDAVTDEVVTDPSKPGVYNVAISVDAKATKYAYMSDAYAFQLTVTDGTVNESEIAVLYNGKVVSEITPVYDGSDIVKGIEVVATTDEGEKTLTAGKEYNYKIVDNDTGKEVSSIVNVNEEGYTLTIVGGTYNIIGDAEDLTIEIEVQPITPLEIRVADTVSMVDEDGDSIVGLPYTGEEIVPTFEYYTQADLDAAEKAAEKATKTDLDQEDDDELEVIKEYLVWTALPTDVYTTELTDEYENYIDKANGKVDLVGGYEMTLKMVEGNLNYDITDVDEVPFQVINASIFKDVNAGDWYAEVVFQAAQNRYMNGIGNGLFQPMGSVTRGMAACILYNMAGGADNNLGGMINNTEITNGIIGFVTPFEDVDAYKWYAQAIQFCEKAGIVNGWVEDGEKVFAPDQDITREQWAAMLANYAKVYGGFKAPAADALAGFADAGQVSGWAKESVAWAVENKIMGNGGAINAKATITRAEAAAMAVNYQPEPIVELVY